MLVPIKHFMRGYGSIDNTASWFYAQPCTECVKFWDNVARRLASPYCLWETWHGRKIIDGLNADPQHLYEFEIPDPLPGHCSKFEQK
jgi:hypothetical protein